MIFLEDRRSSRLSKAAAAASFPIERVKRRAAALAQHHTWRKLIDHGTYGLISAERAELSKPVNEGRTHELYHHLVSHGFSPVPATGYYGGKPEKSFLVTHHDPQHLHQTLGHLANKYQQESYIVRHNSEHKMIFPHGSSEHPSAHHLKGTQVLHHLTPSEDRSVLHTGTRHTHPFRMNDFFDNPAHEGEGFGRSYSCMGHKHAARHAFIVAHTTSGPRRFSLHFEAEPHEGLPEEAMDRDRS